MGGRRPLTTERFIELAIEKHNGKYSYDKTRYIKYHEKLIITCSQHGDFFQSPASHLRGRGCGRCVGRKDTSLFIEASKQIHGDRFTYNNLHYQNSNTKVSITCQYHGDFLSNPRDHLAGNGCPKCIGRNRTIKEWIDVCVTQHGCKYDYSNSIYVGSDEKIEIVCPKHGSFWQLAYNHLKGRGCPKCSRNISKSENQWLDYLGIPVEYRHQRLNIKGYKRSLVVDAYDPLTNTIYEFYGDLWHGNPKIYNQTEPHRVAKSKGTYGDLYIKTIEREEKIRLAGYNLITIWENEWAKIK